MDKEKSVSDERNGTESWYLVLERVNKTEQARIEEYEEQTEQAHTKPGLQTEARTGKTSNRAETQGGVECLESSVSSQLEGLDTS